MTDNDAVFDAILAAMSHKSGNTSETTENSTNDETRSHISDPGKKRRFHAIDEALNGKDVSTAGIWNPIVPSIISLRDVQAQVNHPTVKNRIDIESALLEVERYRLVKQFYSMIEEAAAELGIATVPNSVYEVWKFTCSLFTSKVCIAFPEFIHTYDRIDML